MAPLGVVNWMLGVLNGPCRAPDWLLGVTDGSSWVPSRPAAVMDLSKMHSLFLAHPCSTHIAGLLCRALFGVSGAGCWGCMLCCASCTVSLATGKYWQGTHNLKQYFDHFWGCANPKTLCRSGLPNMAGVSSGSCLRCPSLRRIWSLSTRSHQAHAELLKACCTYMYCCTGGVSKPHFSNMQSRGSTRAMAMQYKTSGHFQLARNVFAAACSIVWTWCCQVSLLTILHTFTRAGAV